MAGALLVRESSGVVGPIVPREELLAFGNVPVATPKVLDEMRWILAARPIE